MHHGRVIGSECDKTERDDFLHSASLRQDQPSIRVFVDTGDQTGLARVVEASTTTDAFVAHEMRKPNWFGLMPRLLFSISGLGRNHCAVG